MILVQISKNSCPYENSLPLSGGETLSIPGLFILPLYFMYSIFLTLFLSDAQFLEEWLQVWIWEYNFFHISGNLPQIWHWLQSFSPTGKILTKNKHLLVCTMTGTHMDIFLWGVESQCNQIYEAMETHFSCKISSCGDGSKIFSGPDHYPLTVPTE